MRQHKIRDAVLAQYAPSPKPLPYKYTPMKSKGSTLQEFYEEVNAKISQYQDHVYQNKNAQEIESIMAQNRRLIEAQRKVKR